MKNKGFTLIELIVAMAVGSIVLLMVSVMLVRGTSIFRAENDEVNMRNDYQVVRNQIDQVIMEAKTLIIERRTNGDILIYTGDILTGDIDKNREFATSNITTERIITYSKGTKSIYISSSYVDHTSEGNRICDIVESFNIELAESSKVEVMNDDGTAVKEVYYTNPLRVDITIGLTQKNSVMTSSFSVNMRNRLKGITMYTTDNGSLLLSELSDANVLKYDVK